MKQTYLILLILLSGVFSLQAQKSELRIGVQFNPVITSFSLSKANVESDGASLGFQVGALAEYGLTDRLMLTGGLRLNVGFGGDILYDKGGNFWPTSDLTDEAFRNLPAGTSLKYSMQFIEIPVGFQYYTGEIGNTNLRGYIQAPMFSLLMSTRSRGSLSGSSAEPENILDDTRFFNLGVGFGLGVIPDWMGSSDLKLGLHYQSIFTDILNDGQFSDGEVEDSKAKLGVISFRLTLLI